MHSGHHKKRGRVARWIESRGRDGGKGDRWRREKKMLTIQEISVRFIEVPIECVVTSNPNESDCTRKSWYAMRAGC